MPPPASHGATAAAAYYKALETGAPHGGRRIKIDYSQSVSPQDKGRAQRGNVNDGTRDIGNTQAPVLLFRGLDPLSGPQAIHQAMRNSAGFGKDGAKGMKRIILIKDRITMASFGFGFVEFIDTPVRYNGLALVPDSLSTRAPLPFSQTRCHLSCTQTVSEFPTSRSPLPSLILTLFNLLPTSCFGTKPRSRRP